MKNISVTIGNKLYLAAKLYNGWAVQVKRPGARPETVKYTRDGHKTLLADGFQEREAARFMDILAGDAKPKEPTFKVLS